mmetsp:Transcript_57481/g.134954  ORF Transcript_57481/g.134954 Transcript_57481/m.134954 type:complete len:311 (-) Transcript_57481:627-1559(-)
MSDLLGGEENPGYEERHGRNDPGRLRLEEGEGEEQGEEREEARGMARVGQRDRCAPQFLTVRDSLGQRFDRLFHHLSVLSHLLVVALGERAESDGERGQERERHVVGADDRRYPSNLGLAARCQASNAKRLPYHIQLRHVPRAPEMLLQGDRKATHMPQHLVQGLSLEANDRHPRYLSQRSCYLGPSFSALPEALIGLVCPEHKQDRQKPSHKLNRPRRDVHCLVEAPVLWRQRQDNCAESRPERHEPEAACDAREEERASDGNQVQQPVRSGIAEVRARERQAIVSSELLDQEKGRDPLILVVLLFQDF